MKNQLLIVCLALCLSAAARALSAADLPLIQPGEVWPDDRGQHIQAHGGGILQMGKVYYWFGEDRSMMNARTNRYVGKIIIINKGHRLSRQYHKVKQESFYVLKGRPLVEIGDKRRVLSPGSAVDILPHAVHRVSAPHGRVTLLEVSTPEMEDLIRLEDDYARS